MPGYRLRALFPNAQRGNRLPVIESDLAPFSESTTLKNWQTPKPRSSDHKAVSSRVATFPIEWRSHSTARIGGGVHPPSNACGFGQYRRSDMLNGSAGAGSQFGSFPPLGR